MALASEPKCCGHQAGGERPTPIARDWGSVGAVGEVALAMTDSCVDSASLERQERLFGRDAQILKRW